MKRRLVLALTTAAVLAGGIGAASATGPGITTSDGGKQHQLCVLFYHDDGRPPTPVCLNY